MQQPYLGLTHCQHLLENSMARRCQSQLFGGYLPPACLISSLGLVVPSGVKCNELLRSTPVQITLKLLLFSKPFQRVKIQPWASLVLMSFTRYNRCETKQKSSPLPAPHSHSLRPPARPPPQKKKKQLPRVV